MEEGEKQKKKRMRGEKQKNTHPNTTPHPHGEEEETMGATGGEGRAGGAQKDERRREARESRARVSLSRHQTVQP